MDDPPTRPLGLSTAPRNHIIVIGRHIRGYAHGRFLLGFAKPGYQIPLAFAAIRLAQKAAKR